MLFKHIQCCPGVLHHDFIFVSAYAAGQAAGFSEDPGSCRHRKFDFHDFVKVFAKVD